MRGQHSSPVANGSKKGYLEVICGSMFSGKTEELMRRLRRSEYAKKRVLTVKHQIDNRRHSSCVGRILSHDGRERVAFTVEPTQRGLQRIIDLSSRSVDVIGIDEIQFFPEYIFEVILQLIDVGKYIVVAGLDLDFRGEPFGIMPQLLCLADDIVKLRAICVKCGKNAHHSQRFINGKSACYDDPLILVGSEECYEPRCRECFSIEKSRHFTAMRMLGERIL